MNARGRSGECLRATRVELRRKERLGGGRGSTGSSLVLGLEGSRAEEVEADAHREEERIATLRLQAPAYRERGVLPATRSASKCLFKHISNTGA